jgi:transposase-like protein
MVQAPGPESAGESSVAVTAPTGVPPRYSREQMLAAVGDLEAGVKAPVVCHRHGISERTLYRWRRTIHAGRHGPHPGSDPRPDAERGEGALAADALRIVVAGLGPGGQLRALQAVEAGLRITRARARQLLGLARERDSEADSGG